MDGSRVDDREPEIPEMFAALWHAVHREQFFNIGFPGATDIDYRPLTGLFGTLFNNVGDPVRAPAGRAHTMDVERQVLAWFGDLFGAAPGDRWGYLTPCGTESNEAALLSARRRYPGAIAYYSTAAHYSVAKTLDILRISGVAVRADARGEMDYADLEHHIGLRRDLPAIVVATAGTTMTGAVDDVARIDAILTAHHVHRRHLHVDAALDGVPLALDGALQLVAPVDSIAVSGHKFFGMPVPCGLVLIRGAARPTGRDIAYTATLDTTISGSRAGQPALLLQYAIARYGRQGHHDRATAARVLAAHTVEQLTAVGWPAWRHPHSFIVNFATPPPEVTERWVLASENGFSHLICMPGVTPEQISAFVTDVARTTRGVPGPPIVPRPLLDRPNAPTRPLSSSPQRHLSAPARMTTLRPATPRAHTGDAAGPPA